MEKNTSEPRHTKRWQKFLWEIRPVGTTNSLSFPYFRSSFGGAAISSPGEFQPQKMGGNPTKFTKKQQHLIAGPRGFPKFFFSHSTKTPSQNVHEDWWNIPWIFGWKTTGSFDTSWLRTQIKNAREKPYSPKLRSSVNSEKKTKNKQTSKQDGAPTIVIHEVMWPLQVGWNNPCYPFSLSRPGPWKRSLNGLFSLLNMESPKSSKG